MFETTNEKTARMSLNSTTVLKLYFQTNPNAKGVSVPFYCNIDLLSGFSSPVYDCVSFLPPRSEGGLNSLEKVSLLLFEPVSALHPSAPIAVPLWRDLPGGQYYNFSTWRSLSPSIFVIYNFDFRGQ